MKQSLLAILLFFVSGIVLTEIYKVVGSMLGEDWLGAAVVNSILSVCFLSRRFEPSMTQNLPLSRKLKNAYLAFIPAAVVCFGSLLLAIITKQWSPDEGSLPISWHQYLWVLWIPIIEEICFRRGFGSIFKGMIGPFWGSYLSVLFFSFMHSAPSFDAVIHGQFGLALGPLLLAIICEYLYQASRRLMPAIALHAACNLTVLIFSYFNPSWLDRLNFLYQ